MDISFLVKTLNEAQHIQTTLFSINQFRKQTHLRTELIVADAGSTDQTLQYAIEAGATVFSLVNEPKGCGITLEAAYQQSSGEFLFVIDGDMELVADFVHIAYEELINNPQYAGCAGLIHERCLRNEFDRNRQTAFDSISEDCFVAHLNGGGLYRRSAINKSGGYIANSNLRAFEEAELGMRLRAAGYHLIRKNIFSVWHTGHAAHTLGLMMKHLLNARTNSAGVLLKVALKQTWRKEAIRHLLRPLFILMGWCITIVFGFVVDDGNSLEIWCLLLGAVSIGLAIKRRRWYAGLISVLDWHCLALGIFFGFFISLQSPKRLINVQLVSQ